MKFSEIYAWYTLAKSLMLPHLPTILLYVLAFCVLGLLLSLPYVLILWKKKLLVRQQKYYGYVVKLYVPASVLLFICFFGLVGLLVAAKSIIKAEQARAVTEIYEATVSQAFETPQKKAEFIQELQALSKEIQHGSKGFTKALGQIVKSKDVGIYIVDESKNRLTNYFLEKYQSDIYSAVLYGIISASAKHISLGENMTHEDMDDIIHTMNTADPKQIETGIKDKLIEMVNRTVSGHFNSLIKMVLVMLTLLLLIPFIEFAIYQWWQKRQQAQLAIGQL